MKHCKFEDLSGRRFGYLTVISYAGHKNNRIYFNCKCDCGNQKEIRGSHLKGGLIVSCGCYHKKVTSTISQKVITHGKSQTRLYRVFMDMKTRCYNSKSKDYKNYGGRGITICKEWLQDYTSFEDWALKNGYDESAKKGVCTIDRINVNGNYEPSNCRWVSNKEQANNKTTNHYITYNGETKTISQWSSITGISKSVILNRLVRHKWSVKRALTEPINIKYAHNKKRGAK
jgi:hypothetical protein